MEGQSDKQQMIPLEIVGMNFENLEMPTHVEKCMIIRRLKSFMCFFSNSLLCIPPVFTCHKTHLRLGGNENQGKQSLLCPKKACSFMEPSNGKQCGFFANKLCCCNLNTWRYTLDLHWAITCLSMCNELSCLHLQA